MRDSKASIGINLLFASTLLFAQCSISKKMEEIESTRDLLHDMTVLDSLCKYVCQEIEPQRTIPVKTLHYSSNLRCS